MKSSFASSWISKKRTVFAHDNGCMTQCLYRRRLGSFEGSGTSQPTSQPPAESLSCRSSCTAAAAASSSPSASHSQESLWRQSLFGDNLWIFCFIAIDVSDLRSSRERKSEHLEDILHATTPLFLRPVSGLLHLRLIVFLRGRAFARFPGSSSHNFVFLEVMQGKKTPFRFLFLLVPLRIHHRVLYLIAKPKVEFCIVIFSLIAFIMDWLTIISCCSSSIRRRRRKRKEEGANASSVSLAVSCSCRSTNNHVSCIDYIGIWSQVPSLCTLDGSSDCSLFCMLQCLDHQPL